MTDETTGFGLCGTAETIIAAIKDTPSITNLTVVSNNAGDGVIGLGASLLPVKVLSRRDGMLTFQRP